MLAAPLLLLRKGRAEAHQVNVTPSSRALVSLKGSALTKQRQRTQPVAAPTVVLLRGSLRVPAIPDQRVFEVSATDSDLIPARRDTQANAQIALYEFVKSGNASARKGAQLDVFA